MYFALPRYSIGGTPVLSEIVLHGDKVSCYKIEKNIIACIQKHFGIYSTIAFADPDGNFINIDKDIKVVNNALSIEVLPLRGKNFYFIDWYIGEYTIYYKDKAVLTMVPDMIHTIKDQKTFS